MMIGVVLLKKFVLSPVCRHYTHSVWQDDDTLFNEAELLRRACERWTPVSEPVKIPEETLALAKAPTSSKNTDAASGASDLESYLEQAPGIRTKFGTASNQGSIKALASHLLHTRKEKTAPAQVSNSWIDNDATRYSRLFNNSGCKF